MSYRNRKYKRLLTKLKALEFTTFASDIPGKTVDRAFPVLDRGEVQFLIGVLQREFDQKNVKVEYLREDINV